MENILLRVKSRKAYKELMNLLQEIGENEIELVSGTEFEKQKCELEKELENMNEGKAEFTDLDEVDLELERIISQYEDKAIR
ncbi:hypothetical protein RM553_06470 [Zunongwangia sp. F363]|uniref:Uncharacterized protein n=1 Tax=Autumnicola tepida TaxID=3075595 RepID=A0ABU3C803_9FLAO|nr:hypothetical protein [Zunongwangia sp. F363]MDT0642473.1 hypothetical protein [Zunongwangia sp. F363]